MSRSFQTLVERQIAKAIADGQLSGLDGEGKPLPDQSGEAFSDVATQAAVRLMAEAGAVPKEFKLKKLLHAARTTYQEAANETEKYLAFKLISDLELRYNIAVEARRRFMAP